MPGPKFATLQIVSPQDACRTRAENPSLPIVADVAPAAEGKVRLDHRLDECVPVLVLNKRPVEEVRRRP
jgi:hypothetical protein